MNPLKIKSSATTILVVGCSTKAFILWASRRTAPGWPAPASRCTGFDVRRFLRPMIPSVDHPHGRHRRAVYRTRRELSRIDALFATNRVALKRPCSSPHFDSTRDHRDAFRYNLDDLES